MEKASLIETPPLVEAEIRRDGEEVRLLSKLFDGFAEPTRMSILALLTRREEASVTELVEAVGAPQPRVSDHLRCLTWCGYVRARREGRYAYYSIADGRVLQMLRLGEEILADNRERVRACDVTDES
jgi:DNA-binding transcriptional ArsR family regulator